MLQRSKSYQIEHRYTQTQIHFNNVCVLIPAGNIERKLGCRGTMEQVYDIWQTGYEKLIKNYQVHHPLFTLNYCHFTIWWTVIKIQSFSKQKRPPQPTYFACLQFIFRFIWFTIEIEWVYIVTMFVLVLALFIVIIIIIFIIRTRLPISQFNESPYWWRKRYLLTVERIYANSASWGPQGKHAYLLL